MKHLILGTAGHIDHGKTSLVKALTGIDCDRLPEEKSRGITIELGFAHLELGEGIQFGIVDVPGHERFVRTMVAGVGGMDMVMLVIAADEGIMPQTREHMDICQLLGVKKGLVALSKSDLVDGEWIGLQTEEIRDYVKGTFLEGGAIIPVSARSGAGLDDLRNELIRLAAEVGQKRGEGPFRLPVDRVFTVAGFGTVVTGTLLSGQVMVGDDVEILPKGLTSRVRGLQVHGMATDLSVAGQRLAMNLQGIDHIQVQRGDAVVPSGCYRPTVTVDVRLEYLASAPRDLKHRAVLRLHSATYEVSAQVILFDGSRLSPGEQCFAQLRLSRPVLLLPNDPFVLRSATPSATLGGGIVLDPDPPRRRRRSAEATELLEVLAGGDEPIIVSRLISSSLLSGLSFDQLHNRTGLPPRRLDAILAPLLSSGEVVQVVRDPRVYLGSSPFAVLKEQLFGAVQSFMREHPLKEGIGKEELKTRIPQRSDRRFFAPALLSLEKEGKVLVDRELVKLPGHNVEPAADHAEFQLRIERALQNGWSEPPTLKELCDQLRIPEKEILTYLHLLTRQGRAIKVNNDLFYAPLPLAKIQEELLGFLNEKKEISPTEFREMTGLSRKFMIPLLEYFDAQKITIRVGDKRLLRGSRP